VREARSGPIRQDGDPGSQSPLQGQEPSVKSEAAKSISPPCIHPATGWQQNRDRATVDLLAVRTWEARHHAASALTSGAGYSTVLPS